MVARSLLAALSFFSVLCFWPLLLLVLLALYVHQVRGRLCSRSHEGMLLQSWPTWRVLPNSKFPLRSAYPFLQVWLQLEDEGLRPGRTTLALCAEVHKKRALAHPNNEGPCAEWRGQRHPRLVAPPANFRWPEPHRICIPTHLLMWGEIVAGSGSGTPRLAGYQ